MTGKEIVSRLRKGGKKVPESPQPASRCKDTAACFCFSSQDTVLLGKQCLLRAKQLPFDRGELGSCLKNVKE